MPDVIFNADAHFTDPPDLWQTRLPKKFRDQALHVSIHGRYSDWVLPGAFAATFGRFVDSDGEFVTDDPDAQLRHLERDGIWGAVLMPNAGLYQFVIDDPELAMAHAQVYNDYVVEVLGSHFDRFLPVAPIPIGDSKAAAAEVDRVAALGIRGITVPTIPPYRYSSDRYDAVWAACQANGMVVTFHTATGRALQDQSKAQGLSMVEEFRKSDSSAAVADRLRAQYLLIQPVFPAVQDLVGGGVLERFPQLHFIGVEFNAYWLSGLMASMDKAFTLGIGQWEEWEAGNWDHDRADDDQPAMARIFGMNNKWPLPLRPSEYVKRQMHFTFMDDPMAVAARHLTGVRTLLWGSDYPHAEGPWPRSREAIDNLFADVSPDERSAMLGGTLADLFNVELPSASDVLTAGSA